MRHSTLGWCVAILASVVIFPAQAQERSRQSVDEPSANISSGSQGGGSFSAAPAASSQGTPSGGATSSTSGGSIAGGGFSQSQPASNFPQIPKLGSTSFGSTGTYLRWETYSYYMLNRFMMDPFYFNRFYRNVEPLITPELLRLSTAEPLKASTMMLSSANELQALIAALKAGEPVSRQEIASRTQAIHKLAGKIRKDQSLSFIDQRNKIDILKGRNPEDLGLSAISQLCEIATALHSQLAGMNRQTSTSTISVHTLTQPSIGSLSSGIEKLAKVIEDSAKRI
jgi:hypothetical protein